MTGERSLKPVIWAGSSRNDLRGFPEPVQDHIGYALHVARRGSKHRDTKTLSGFGGAGCRGSCAEFSRRHLPGSAHLEVSGGAVRASRLPEEIEGRPETPRRDIELVKQRLREAEQIARRREP